MSAAYDPTRVEPYTPAEVREIARAAYRAGVDRMAPFVPLPGAAALRAEAADLYPAPMVERPRVWTGQRLEKDAVFHFRVVNGGIQWANEGMEDWTDYVRETGGHIAYVTPEFLRAIADLRENPTERVPASEVAP